MSGGVRIEKPVSQEISNRTRKAGSLRRKLVLTKNPPIAQSGLQVKTYLVVYAQLLSCPLLCGIIITHGMRKFRRKPQTSSLRVKVVWFRLKRRPDGKNR